MAIFGSSLASLAIRALQILFALLPSLDEGIYPTQTILKNNTSYDYIVIGGGSAGSVVATRLAEVETNSVLVLEAGYIPPKNSRYPGLFVTLPKSKYDYDYQSTFDPYAASSQGNHTTLTAGKMLGGCDSLNHLVHGRGCPKDFDDWANVSGEESWSYKNFLKYFIKSERVDDEEIVEAYPQFHGTEGPMGLSRQLETDDVKPYLESFAEVGHPTVLDLNANVSIGYTQPLYMLAEGIRQTPSEAYVGKVKSNSNLHVSYETLATRILFEGNVAVAVEAIHKGKTYILRAKKEIALSAGVMGSPQVLMLSGFGPKNHLKKMKINVLADLPVGNHFTDQVATTVVFKTKKYLLPVPNPVDSIPIPTKVPFPVLVGSVALNKTQKCPDYQVFSLLLPHDTPQVTLACHNTFWYRGDICDKWQKEVTGRDALYNVITQLTSNSRGTIRLKSNDPLDTLQITTNYFKDPKDLDDMINYVMNFIEVGKTTFFKEEEAEIIDLDLVECKNEKPLSYEFWKCYILNRAISPYHYTGSCSMGSVVNGNLTLKGFERIRVIDASVIPVTPKAAPSAAVIALAEKGADMMKQNN